MVDVNEIVRGILKRIDGIRVTFYHPETFNKLPIISYYELTTTTGFCADNAEQGQDSNVCIDIWGNSGAECSRIAILVDKEMQAESWYRSFSRDMTPEDGVYHKTMRYRKTIYFD
ncbi:MAG: hypothetical protein Q4G33_09845 [bacterium]|nr:hypothetical protein [bacterium]